MQTIHKYVLKNKGRQIVLLPEGAEFLSVQVQYEQVCLWAKVETKNPKVAIVVRVYATGEPMETPDDLKYIGTFRLHKGSFIGHVFYSEWGQNNLDKL